MMIVDAPFLKEGIRGISFGWVSFLPTIDTFVSVVYVCFNPMINWGKLKEEAWGRRWDCLIDFDCEVSSENIYNVGTSHFV